MTTSSEWLQPSRSRETAQSLSYTVGEGRSRPPSTEDACKGMLQVYSYRQSSCIRQFGHLKIRP